MVDAGAITLPEEDTLWHARDQDIPQIIALVSACDAGFGR